MRSRQPPGQPRLKGVTKFIGQETRGVAAGALTCLDPLKGGVDLVGAVALHDVFRVGI